MDASGKSLSPQISTSSESRFGIANNLSDVIRNYVQYTTWIRLFTHCSLCIGTDGWSRPQKTAQCAVSDSSLPHYCKHSKSKLWSEQSTGFSLLFILQGPIALLLQPIKNQGCARCLVSPGPWSVRLAISVRKRSGCQGDRNWTEESTGLPWQPENSRREGSL